MAEYNWDKFDKAIDADALANDVNEAAENGANFREVPHGTYEVEVNKLELITSKAGDPMMTAWFKVISGDYKGCLIFMNQVVTMGFQIHIANEMLRSLVQEKPDMEIKMNGRYKDYANLIMDVFEAIDGNYEYALDYSEGKKGFSNYEITEVFVLE